MILPESFQQSMRDLLDGEYDDFIRSFEDKSVSGLRVNTSKISTYDFEKNAPFHTEKIPYIDNGYYISDTDAWTKHPYYYAGLYYIQDPSAMLPAVTIPLDKNSVVLDLCAAPGGKSTGISTRDHAVLVSNDISRSRTIPLVKNLELFGESDCLVTCEEPAKLAGLYAGCFDRILVDAPCSGEGMFRKDPSLISEYERKGPSEYAAVQKEILNSAYRLLAPGGYILYSTCTYSDIEDEQVILSLLDEHDDLCVCEIEKNCGLAGPYKKYENEGRINGCVHAFLHRFRGEGHFMALIKKEEKNGETGNAGKRGGGINTGFDDLPKAAEEFMKNLSPKLRDRILSSSFIVGDDGNIYMLPENIKYLYDKKIRYSRTGTCIGSVNKNGRFTPHTAFALYMKSEDYRYTLNLQADDPMVLKYLKGETLICDTDVPSGNHVMVCVDSYPLGFTLYDGNRFKNLYEKGWIYR